MKTIITLLTMVITTAVFTQNEIEKEIGEFTELKVYDLIEVEMMKSNKNKVIITGENTDDVVVNNKNGKLKIKMSLEEIFDGAKTKVVLYYSGVDVIDVNEGATVHSKDIINQFEVDLKAQEGGSIQIPIDVKYANIKAVTGGIIKTNGSAVNQKIALFTGGVYKGSELKTEKTDVSINAAGEAYVNASKLVDIKIRAGGDVYVYGDPETINESKVLGGRVKRMD
ncbi:head GIN domain-containing protein [Aestuariivivens sediminis]|uniref:head GIN domain-containing protein n=1 Tax=Aestuariivivens sediminis TaxID=2913557 RepID=UPI001F57245A|nr:head GIN domain-containing protein [Aestuariivivens sediminis]